ncbi:hypothetical protein Cantr_03654 [Candida viswanathii]|uniref:DUF7702 domain-containing protein n=1 Tax=Candida viswanathii TaxID=5486 RepID=A0A367XNV1_9ASCO|nr:hypothetical protein Cantr_03654 [Candida viswanathii]
MQLHSYTEWEAVSYVQLFIFAIFFVEFSFSIIYKLRKRVQLKPILPFGIFFTLFVLLKLTGGILGLVFMHQPTFNLSLFIPTYIFDTISLGFITRSISSLIEHMLNLQDAADLGRFPQHPMIQFKVDDIDTQKDADDNNFAKNFWPFKLVTVVLLVAVALSIAGTSQATETNPPSSVGTLLKTSSVLFLIGVLLMIGILVYILSMGEQFNIVAKLLILGLAILLVRCVYSMLAVFHGISFQTPNKYMIFFGDYKYYTFLGLLSEAWAALCVLVASWYW